MDENVKSLLKRIQDYFNFDQSDSIFRSIAKSLILVICGSFLGFIIKEIQTNDINFKHIIIFTCLLITYIYIEYRRLNKEKNFPITILEHLTATIELSNLSKNSARKEKIYEYIASSILSLNENTCPISNENENTFCQQDLKNGLETVLSDIINQTHYVLDINVSKFTVGIFLSDLWVIDSEGTFNKKDSAFIFRDDLSITNYIPEQLSQNDEKDETNFLIQKSMQESLHFSHFTNQKIDSKNFKGNILCSPIVNVCEDCPPYGIIFCFYNGNHEIPNDVDGILLIYGRILSNWISKYIDCARKRIIESIDK